MIKVLFICHGNICRSPMAEFVLKDLVARNGLTGQVAVASAATSREEIGNDVHPGARRKLAEAGVPCEKRQARQMVAQDYAVYDYLIGMDSANIRNIQRICGGDGQHKIHRLLEYAGSNADIADPWYTGNFEETYDDVLRGCNGLLREIGQRLNRQ